MAQVAWQRRLKSMGTRGLQMTQRMQVLIVLVAIGGMLSIATHEVWAGPFLLAQNGASTPAPSGPPVSSPAEATSTVPPVQKSYIFEWFYVPLLIALSLTAICKSSGRS